MAKSLEDVAVREDAEVEFLGAEISVDGVVRIERGAQTTALPRTPEELR